MLILEKRRRAIAFKVCALASGSRGNCIYIQSGGTRLLIDAGLTMRDTKLRLALIGVKPEELSAVIISHEHTDHVKGAGAIGRAFGLPVYMTPSTKKAGAGWLGGKLTVREFEAGSPFEVGDIRVEPFSTPHDAVDPVGFTFYAGRQKVGFATDLGYATSLVIERLKGSNLLVLESNHDPAMLKAGPYPWQLKQRVAGREGHLSNEDAGRLLTELLHDGLSHVVLAHLSQINNLPELAFGSASRTISGSPYGDVRIGVAMQDSVGELIEV